MTSIEVWADSQIFRPRAIYGLRLKPFCLGHYLTLIHAKSPILLGGETSPEDFWFAVKICSMDPDEGIEYYFAENFDADARTFVENINQSTWSLPEALTFFREYIDEALNGIGYVMSSDQTRQRTGTPWWHSMKLTLMGRAGLSESAVMSRWLRTNIYDWFSVIESQDPKSFRLKDDDDFDSPEESEFKRSLTQDEIREAIERGITFDELLREKSDGN